MENGERRAEEDSEVTERRKKKEGRKEGKKDLGEAEGGTKAMEKERGVGG